MSGQYKKILVLPNIRIHNANALSSPYTLGFPAMTAWLGAVHALQRKLNERECDVLFPSVGVASHQMDLQIYRGENDFVSSIIGTGNPLDKTGARSSFIEEARCHLEVSLFVEVVGINQQQEQDFIEKITHIFSGNMKIAGGDIQAFNAPYIIVIEDGNEADFRKLTRKLMPAYVLIERRDLMIEAMEQGQDAMAALIDYLAIHHTCQQSEDGEITWKSQRKTQKDKPAGWIVPIATGFHGISELGEAKNQRDAETPHRFAESLVTLGEFKMPHRFNSVDQMLWRYQVDTDNNLYQCVQAKNTPLHQPITLTLDEEFS